MKLQNNLLFSVGFSNSYEKELEPAYPSVNFKDLMNFGNHVIEGGGIFKDSVPDGNEYALPGGHVTIGETTEATFIREYMEEAGLDAYGMDDEELLSQSEIFPLSKGRYLIVEG